MSKNIKFILVEWQYKFFNRPIFQLASYGQALDDLLKGNKLLCAKASVYCNETISASKSNGFDFYKDEIDFVSSICECLRNPLFASDATNIDQFFVAQKVESLYIDSLFFIRISQKKKGAVFIKDG